MDSEAVVQRCSIIMVFLEISQNLQENICASLFFNKKEPEAYTFIQKETLFKFNYLDYKVKWMTPILCLLCTNFSLLLTLKMVLFTSSVYFLNLRFQVYLFFKAHANVTSKNIPYKSLNSQTNKELSWDLESPLITILPSKASFKKI